MTTITEADVQAPYGAAGTLAAQRYALPRFVSGKFTLAEQYAGVAL